MISKLKHSKHKFKYLFCSYCFVSSTNWSRNSHQDMSVSSLIVAPLIHSFMPRLKINIHTLTAYSTRHTQTFYRRFTLV